MAYDKYTWQTGEVITAEKLNHIEDGIEGAYELPSVSASDNGKVLGVEDGAWSLVNGGGVLVVNINEVIESEEIRYAVLDKTWQEIYDAVRSNGVVTVTVEGETTYVEPVSEVSYNSNINKYTVGRFETNSPTGYPKMGGVS